MQKLRPRAVPPTAQASLPFVLPTRRVTPEPIKEEPPAGPPSKAKVAEIERTLQKGWGNSTEKKGKGKTSVDDGSSARFEKSKKIDPSDPLYDPEDDESYILVSGEDGLSRSPRNYDPTLRRMVTGPMLLLSEFKRRVTTTLEEYFSSEDVEEALRTIQELACPDYHYEIVKRAISLSLDRSDRERELVSKFLSAAHPKTLPVEQLGKGFERVFEFVDDLEIDVPGASDIVAAFVARALVDGERPPWIMMCEPGSHSPLAVAPLCYTPQTFCRRLF